MAAVELTELVKALSIAELEAQGRYIEAEHDLFFEAFDENALTADDLARFPDYLVCIPPDRNDAPENVNLMEMLSSGLPVKVLVQTSDLLEEASIGTGRFAFGVRSARLATAARRRRTRRRRPSAPASPTTRFAGRRSPPVPT